MNFSKILAAIAFAHQASAVRITLQDHKAALAAFAQAKAELEAFEEEEAK